MAGPTASTAMPVDQSKLHDHDAERTRLSSGALVQQNPCVEQENPQLAEIHKFVDENLEIAEVAAANELKRLREDHKLMFADETLHFIASPVTTFDHLMKLMASNLAGQDTMSSIEDCRAYANWHAREIFTLYAALNTVLNHSEALVRKLWRKKSSEEKEAILLKVWPNMTARHRSDILFVQQRSWKTNKHFMDAIKWPYINLEDLLQPNALLIFLNARGRHPPDTFAHSDLELAPVFKLRKEMLGLRSDNFTMAFLGRSAEDYASLVAWKDSTSTRKAIETGRFVHVDHGIQILEIQYGIMKFLGGCVAEILDGQINGPIGDTKIQPEPPQLVIDGSTCSIVSREAPYKVSLQLDLHRLEALVGARKNQAIDHVRALQEDPGYFAEAVEQYRDHRPELILELDEVPQERVKDFPLYNKAMRQFMIDSRGLVFFWDHAHNYLIKLQDLHTKCASKIDADLPSHVPRPSILSTQAESTPRKEP